MTNQGRDFRSIRQWDGSQHRAFEELCYQLRDPTPGNAELVKTGDPDAGLEWYVTFRNGVQWGWQAKYSFDIDTLLSGMEKSLETVVRKRPKCRRLTFCTPFDLPDAPGTGKRKSARQKFEDRKRRWRDHIPGAERVRIQLWSAGDLLQRLVGHANQRGIERFFWDEEVFSTEWFEQRLSVSLTAARGRYTPELHIDLPVAFALEGLAQSEAYLHKFRTRRDAVLKAASHLAVRSFTGLGVTRQLQLLARSLSKWVHDVPRCVNLPDQVDRTELLTATRTVQEAAQAAYPHENSRIRKKGRAKRQADTRERRQALLHYLRRLEAALDDFEDLLESVATKAAVQCALLLTGDAGQGKTHLFCDVAQRAVNAGRPAVVLFGGQFSGRQVWSEIADRVGLGQVGSEVLIGTMEAAAEASNAPFLLLIDALNEAENPKAWQDELPALLSEVAENPWIVVGLSLRSTYRQIAVREEALPNLAEVDHPGFAGREVEAIERFFNAFGLDQPGEPLLEPEFTNPLFLKLYCESLQETGLKAAPAGAAHVSAVFHRYLESKAQRITHRLDLDPGSRPVERALDAICKALADVNRDSLAYDRGEQVIREFAAGRDQWPDTLLGQLLSEGVLTRDVAWQHGVSEFAEVIRFTYQRFADYRIGSALITPLEGDSERLREALSEGGPLRERILEAPAGWIEALAVQVPEEFGVELLDAAHWELEPFPRSRWDEAFVRSIATRRPSAVTERSRNLLREVQRRSHRLRELVLETILSVAPSPGHPLNADFLHERLRDLEMPERDVVWSIPTYSTMDYGGTLDRLIRWAAQGPYPNCRDDVIELGALPIVWTFTSPNRRLRDYATKALSKLLSGHLRLLPSLCRRFDGVDDPYVLERLAVVAHGAVLCGGSQSKGEVVPLAEELRRVALAETQVPNIITRDAVRGVYEWCARQDLVDCATYREVMPPYGSSPPEEPPTLKELIREFGGEVVNGHSATYPYYDLLHSVFCTDGIAGGFYLGDFGKYVIRPKINQFYPCPLSTSPSEIDGAEAYPEELAQRWVFDRVISLGWTPDKFAEFDKHQVSYRAGRTEHKPERFGKKYQWIALRELLARLTDNFHMGTRFNHRLVTYAGPWQLGVRDIDPTLPPPPRRRDGDDEFELGATFSVDEGIWWKSSGPRYRDSDPVGGNWAVKTEDIPEFEPLVRRSDDRGVRWVALCASANWEDQASEEGDRSAGRRNLWFNIGSWLVHPPDVEVLVSCLARRSLMGHWMAEGRSFVGTRYLGEVPWMITSDGFADCWCPLESFDRLEQVEMEMYPAWSEFLWEGSVLDCSINDSVRAEFPAPLLFKAGNLRWIPGTRRWCTASGVPAAQYVEGDGESALLVREAWLRKTLRRTGHSMVFGLVGEKQLIGGPEYVIGDWTQIDGVASLSNHRWTIGERRLQRCSRPV